MKYFFKGILIVLVFIGCGKDSLKWNLERNNPNDGKITDSTGYEVPNKDAPNVSTGDTSGVTNQGGLVSGEITKIGSSNVTSYGHCWSTSLLPTINDPHTDLGNSNSNGAFSSTISGLLPNKEYYVRAYATNSFGTSYGNQIQLVTLPNLCDYLNCENLTGFTTFVQKISPSSSAAWSIGSGYYGNGLALTQSCYGGYIEFQINNSNPVKMSFWTMSCNPGAPNRTPDVTVDGILSNTNLVKGSNSYLNWMQLQSGNILPGTHTIRIDFTHVSTYYEYYIDEIQFWCQ